MAALQFVGWKWSRFCRRCCPALLPNLALTRKSILFNFLSFSGVQPKSDRFMTNFWKSPSVSSGASSLRKTYRGQTGSESCCELFEPFFKQPSKYCADLQEWASLDDLLSCKVQGMPMNGLAGCLSFLPCACCFTVHIPNCCAHIMKKKPNYVVNLPSILHCAGSPDNQDTNKRFSRVAHWCAICSTEDQGPC